MNYRLITCLLTGLWVGATASAQTAAPAPAPAVPEYTWTLTGSAVSQYMFRGVRLGGPSFQPAVEFGAGNLALGVWTNFPWKDRVQGQSDPEIDPYGSYKFVINDSLSVQPGFTWYTYMDADENAGFYRSTFEPSLALNYSVAGFTLTPKLYYDVVLKGATYEFNAAYALPLKDLGTELDFVGTVGTYKWDDAWSNTNPSMKNWGDYYLIGASMPLQVSTRSKFVLGVTYTKGSGNYLKQGSTPKVLNGAAVGRTYATVSYVFTF